MERLRKTGEVPRKVRRQRKHIPQRTCVGCRQVQSKRTLIRLVRTAEGVLVDPTGKHAGRGAYLHDDLSCWEAGLKGSLSRALKLELSAEDRARLVAYMQENLEEQDG